MVIETFVWSCEKCNWSNKKMTKKWTAKEIYAEFLKLERKTKKQKPKKRKRAKSKSILGGWN